MSGALERLASTFLVPAADDVTTSRRNASRNRARGRRRDVDDRAHAERAASEVDDDLVRGHGAAACAVAVLCRPADAAVAGGAIALAQGGGVAVVLAWGAAPPPVRAPATPRASGLASRLAERGHAARATGRLVHVALQDGIDEAARAAAPTDDRPVVLVVAGPRDERVDAVLAAHDRVVAAGEPLVAELAARSAAGLGVPARTLELPAAPAARGLAAAGVALVAPLRAPVLEALR